MPILPLRLQSSIGFLADQLHAGGVSIQQEPVRFGSIAVCSRNFGPCTCADKDDNYASVFTYSPSDSLWSLSQVTLVALLISFLLVVQRVVLPLHTAFTSHPHVQECDAILDGMHAGCCW